MSVLYFMVFINGLFVGISFCQDAKDYCLEDIFNATCPYDHVILITQANYGRMKANKCISGEGGNLGCSINVVDTFDTRCSGKRTCIIEVNDLVKFKPCNKDFASYLVAGYRCIRVGQTIQGSCTQDISPPIMKGPEGFIMYSNEPPYKNTIPSPSYKTAGIANCPWNIEVKKGQMINLTLLTIANKDKTGGSMHCSDELQINDGKETNNIQMCWRQRVKHIYISKHHKIEVFLSKLNYIEAKNAQKLIIQYEAIGCPDIDPPIYGWAKRQGIDTLMVKCNFTEETWYLTCSEKQWIGGIGNCTHGSLYVPSSSGDPFPRYIPHAGIVFAVLIGIVLGVTIGALLLLTVHLCKRKRTLSSKSNFIMVPQDIKEKYYEEGNYTPSMAAKDGQLKDPFPALLRDSEIYEVRGRQTTLDRIGCAPMTLKNNSANNTNNQCFSTDVHNIHIKAYPHDKSMYNSLEQHQCAECPNQCTRCETVTNNRYLDIEQQQQQQQH